MADSPPRSTLLSNARHHARWACKKAARNALALGSVPRLAVKQALSDTAGSIHVLTYHRFGSVRRDPFCVSPEAFEAQMAWLAREQLALSFDEFKAFMHGRVVPRDGCVLVTIDDGFKSTYSQALPVLRDHSIPAVVFVSSGYIGSGDAENPDAPEPYMSWDELERMAEVGFTVGSHAWSHRSIARMPRAEACREAVRSRELLERRLGRSVAAFAYPFGTRADYNASTAAILREAGYEYGFTSRHGSIRRGDDSLELPRVKVEGGEKLWLFRAMTRGGLDDWRWVDDNLWRLQASAD